MPCKLIKRNGHAFHPIMKKGGAHGKTKKAQRKAAKHDLQKNTQEWLGRFLLWVLNKVKHFIF